MTNQLPDPTENLTVEKLGSINVKALTVPQLQRVADFALRADARCALARSSTELRRRAARR